MRRLNRIIFYTSMIMLVLTIFVVKCYLFYSLSPKENPALVR